MGIEETRGAPRGRLIDVMAALVVFAVIVLTLQVVPVSAGPNASLRGIRCGSNSGPFLSDQNITSDLPTTFSSGSIQAFGSNASSILFGGLSYYNQAREPIDKSPALGSVSPTTAPPPGLAQLGQSYFGGGGVFPVGWNGSAWLIAGQVSVGGATEGSAVALENGRVTNLTPTVGPYFRGEGIYIAGWNGQEWMIGGNDTSGAVLITLRGDTVTNLTSLLPHNGPADWIQMVAWNGTGWLVSGQGIFGAYVDGTYTDLLPGSLYAAGGVFAIGWNGTAWLVAGSPVSLESVRGLQLAPVPNALGGTSGWVNTILALPGGSWLVAGGFNGSRGYAPFLDAIAPGLGEGPALDEGACLAGAFNGGWVQYGAPAPAFGPEALMLVGNEGVNPLTLSSHAAAVLIDVGA